MEERDLRLQEKIKVFNENHFSPDDLVWFAVNDRDLAELAVEALKDDQARIRKIVMARGELKGLRKAIPLLDREVAENQPVFEHILAKRDKYFIEQYKSEHTYDERKILIEALKAIKNQNFLCDLFLSVDEKPLHGSPRTVTFGQNIAYESVKLIDTNTEKAQITFQKYVYKDHAQNKHFALANIKSQKFLRDYIAKNKACDLVGLLDSNLTETSKLIENEFRNEKFVKENSAHMYQSSSAQLLSYVVMFNNDNSERAFENLLKMDKVDNAIWKSISNASENPLIRLRAKEQISLRAAKQGLTPTGSAGMLENKLPSLL